jgi:uncharacterized cupin superfamily protein
MDADQGIFASKLSTPDWEPDPDIGGLMHVLCEVGRVQAGLSRFDQVEGPVTWTLPERETFLILEGKAHIDIAGASSLDLQPGDLASLPKRAITTGTSRHPSGSSGSSAVSNARC